LFKSIQWKIVSMFVLLVVAVMIVFGTFLQDRIAAFYHDNFKQEMTRAFSNELTEQLQVASNSEGPEKRLKELLDLYSGRMGINTNRNYYILDKKNANFIAGSDEGAVIQKTGNIISAMADKIGNSVPTDIPFLDFALPIEGTNGGYIIYVKDNKEQLLEMIRTILTIVAQALFIGIFISVILGFFMSKTITRPITNLTSKAARLAEGEFDSRIDIKAKDEIGKLARTFNHMASMVKNSLDEIAQEKNKLETVLRYMTDGVMAFNVDQNIMHINPAAKSMLCIEDEKAIIFDEYFDKLNADICMAEMIYLEHFATIERDLDIGGKNFRAYFATFKVDNEKLSGVVVVIQDVTEAQRLEMSRREFVANVSHELRTPLTTIKSYAETLLESTENEQEGKFLSVINREVDRMTRIVKDLLTLSSLDHNKLATHRTHFSLDDLIRDIVTKMSMDAKNHKHTITYSPATQLPIIFADLDRIEQVITNIISNAIKYTQDAGKIDVYAGYLYNEVYIKIKDNGIGIPEKDLPRIFERFYRVDKARTRESGGTGLGLAIAQEIIRLHGGTIKIDSEYEKGTEVIIKLPVAKDLKSV